jgi:hypothetical protein
MPTYLKFIIGLAATLLMGWIYHGPVGNGEALIGRLEAQARAAVVESGVPAVEVRLRRDPLARVAVLSGPANDFQREGMGQFPGLNDRVRAIEGISGLEWANPPAAGAGGNRLMPLLLETLILLVLAYLVGVGLAWLLFGRPKKESYL